MDVERELAQHHAATLRAIETGRVELAERRLRAYVNFGQAFLDAASKRGIIFSLDASRSASMMDWRTPTLIINHAYHGILAALRTGNRELILAAANIPLQFMKMSVEKKDFLFYRRISQIYPAILATSYSIGAVSDKELIIDRSWRRLHEFAEFFLPKLTATHDQEIREQFAYELMWRFGDLMKVAMDHEDAPTYAIIGKGLDSLFRDLEIFGLSGDAASSLEAFAAQEKLLIWFGFGAWILRSFVSKDVPREPGHPNPRLVDPSQIPSFFEVISRQFSNIKQLAGVYEHALAREYGSSTWESWLMETLPERQVHTIDFGSWLTYFYTVIGLRLSKTGGLVANDIPEPFRDLDFRMKDIRENVGKIKAEQQDWIVLVPRLAVRTADESADDTFWDYFLSANETAIKEWNRRKEDEIIASPIDPQRITTFHEQCLQGWRERSWFVTVLSSIGQQVERIAEAGSTYLAVDLLIPKEPFTSVSDTLYVGLGRDQGATLGRDMSKQLFSLIENSGSETAVEEVGSYVDKALKVISSMATKESSIAVFLVGDFKLERQFMSAPGFSPRWAQANPRFTFHEYLGDIDNVMVFFTFDEQSSRITIADLTRVGRLIFYSPPENNIEGLLIRVTGFDEGEANRVIEKQPKFLQDADGSTRTREAAVRDLLLKVRVFVGVKIELEIEATDAIKRISIK